MSVSPRPQPNVPFSGGGMIVRDAYAAKCSGVHLAMKTSPSPEVVINFMEGETIPTQGLESLEGWRAIAVLLSPKDARSLGENLIKYADQADQ